MMVDKPVKRAFRQARKAAEAATAIVPDKLTVSSENHSPPEPELAHFKVVAAKGVQLREGFRLSSRYTSVLMVVWF